MKRSFCTLAVVLLGATLAHGYAIQYQWGDIFDEDYSSLVFGPGDDDLIAWMDIGFGATFEKGEVDPANGVRAFNFNGKPDGCLEMYDGIESPTYSPLYGFWHEYGDLCLNNPNCDPNNPGGCAPVNHMIDLTDGSGGLFAPVLRDFARSNLVARYDLGGPRDIDDVRVFSRMTGRDARVFQHYSVYVSKNDGATWQPLAIDVMNGEYGDQNMESAVSFTRVYEPDASLAEGVTNIRFVFYAVGLSANFSLVDPYQGYTGEPADFLTRCGTKVPAEPEDTDGFRRAFVSTFVDEIDVFGYLQGDGNHDFAINLTDWQLFAPTMTGPDNGPVGPTLRPFDFSPKDRDIDLADVAMLQRAYLP